MLGILPRAAEDIIHHFQTFSSCSKPVALHHLLQYVFTVCSCEGHSQACRGTWYSWRTWNVGSMSSTFFHSCRKPPLCSPGRPPSASLMDTLSTCTGSSLHKLSAQVMLQHRRIDYCRVGWVKCFCRAAQVEQHAHLDTARRSGSMQTLD